MQGARAIRWRIDQRRIFDTFQRSFVGDMISYSQFPLGVFTMDILPKTSYFYFLEMKMLSFQELSRKNLSQKFQGYRMLWTLALNFTKKFFQIEKKPDHILADEILNWYLKYQILFLKTRDQNLKIEIFKQKKELITQLNAHFQSLGYQQQITDIRLK